MTPDQTVILTRYVRALCPQQKFDEYTPDAWHDVLAPYDLNDCRAAASNLSGKQVFIAPAEIIAEVKHLRATRVANFVYDPPPADTDPQYLDRLRGQLDAVASGQQPAPTDTPALTGGPHPDVAERLAALGNYIPRHVDELLDEYRPNKAARRTAITNGGIDPLAVDCEWCRARAGDPCRRSGRGHKTHRRDTPHPSRIEDARAAAQGQAS